jgi:Phage replication protein CRI
MLDTIKLGIPLTQRQHERIQAIAYKSEIKQWVLLIPTTGELWFRRITGLAEADQNSYHREIRWDIPATYVSPHSKLVGGRSVEIHRTFLTIELSLPKLAYGHNIHLLYDFPSAIARLKQLLERQFNLQTRAKFVDINQWQVWRVDCCYAWRMPDQQIAQQVLDSLKHLHYPRKKPVIYPTSIVFTGRTYSVKFYLKLPEFKVHDFKALIKAKASLEWINHLEQKADGVLRYEATLRRQYLEKHGIRTVGDLTRPTIQLILDSHLVSNGQNPDLVIVAITAENFKDSVPVSPQEWLDRFWDGRRLTMVDGGTTSLNFSDGVQEYQHQAGGMTVKRLDNPTQILEYFLHKFIGEHGMQRIDEVEAKLMSVYKPVKAARLISFWLYIQRLGTNKAKEMFGRESYYTAKSDLKKAGVSLVEIEDTIVTLKSDFFKNFKLEVPSENSTNRFDDYGDHDNLLNFVPKSNIN